MTQSAPLSDAGDGDRLPPAEIMSTPVFLQNGALASVEQAVEFAVLLDQLRRDNPKLLTKLRLALVQTRPLDAEPKELAALSTMGFVTGKGVPIIDALPIVLPMLRGPLGEEVIDNPFLDRPSRVLFDYLKHETIASVIYSREELKAVHENDMVMGLQAAAPDASWVGYVQGRDGGKPGPTPSRN